ncbi:CsbD family protein [Granulicella paludicola]|uniref:CsbD family protein n=1 Tax=Granulicella paludicola TaxID=474951 RepID=UPI0021E0BE6B|nr:CsbD family protein [Granulicella paludicola]
MTTTTTVHGKIDEGTGKLKQTVGEVSGNEKLANEGAAQQIKGHVEQAWGSIKEAVKESHDRHEPERHDIREKLVSTAQNVKEKIQHAVSPDNKDV